VSLTIGNVQKFASLAVKHYWCHGLINAIPDSAPIDSYVIQAAKDQLRNAGMPVVAPTGPWSSFDMTKYRMAYQLISQAAAVCGLTVAEWELYVFQPGNGAAALVPGVVLPTITQAMASFLTLNTHAANPGAPRQAIDEKAKMDARYEAFLMGARPYNMSKAQINRNYPGMFDAFKDVCEQESLRIARQVVINPARNRAWYQAQFSTFLTATRAAYPFV
jgi:hypothetical protein